MQGKALEDMLYHPGSKDLAMSNAVKGSKANIVVEQNKPNIDRRQQPSVVIPREKQNVPKGNRQVILANGAKKGSFEARADK